jgi:phosphate transport system substrate-binding protein
MNDEFLHALRRDPPPGFARVLKRRLQGQSDSPSNRFWTVRTMLAALLIGGFAVAAALMLRGEDEPAREDRPVAHTAPTSPQRALQPKVTPQPERQITRNDSPAAQPQTQAPEAKDIPLALVTTSLTRPLAEALAARLVRYHEVAQPRVMTMDDEEAFRALCANTDFVMVSRRIAATELAHCRKWGIDVVEWKLGYQAVVLTAGPSADPLTVTPREVFLALARRIPDPSDPLRLIDNPNLTWHDVDPRFDFLSIDVLARASATTRATFMRLVMEAGCDTHPWIRALRRSDRPRYENICHQLRSDGRYREVELSPTLVTQKLWAEPNWLVVLGYSDYAPHRHDLLSTKLDGPAPTLATLTDGTYAAARPVYVYGQRRQLDASTGARMLAYELNNLYAFDSPTHMHGYLWANGLVPLDEVERRQAKEQHRK